jgi:hypothetical protein
MFMVVEEGPLPLAELVFKDLRKILQHLMQGIHLVPGGFQLELKALVGGIPRLSLVGGPRKG